MLFNLDNKFFQTIGAILIPGRLTKQFFKGKHKSYVHPVRVLLVSTIVMIFFLSHALDGKLDNGPRDIYDSFQEDEWERLKAKELDSLKIAVEEDFKGNPEVHSALDTLIHRAQLDEYEEDSINVNQIFSIFGNDEIKIARQDFFTLNDLEIVDKYQITDSWERLIWRQTIRVIKRGDQVVPFLLGNILWLTLVMMPLLALTLKLFYIRHDHYYVEHLVFSMHTHSFSFGLWTVFILIAGRVPDYFIALIFMTIGLYVIFSMKNYYQQSWLKTTFKFFLINGLYVILLGISAILTTLVSIVLF